MREIKFRAWDDVEEQMVYVNYLSWKYPSGLEVNGKNVCLPETLMQYTGLKDKNGKEIYEGDIIKIDEVLYKKNFITDVYFEFGAFRYRHSDGSGSVMDFKSTTKIKGYEKITHDIEVIGNIYANPELLGDKK